MNNRLLLESPPMRVAKIASRLITAAGLLLCSLATSGCASLKVQPWQHDLLAERAMQVDPYPSESAIDDHIYFSKEASSGGRTFSGGGCGCN